MTTKTIRNKWMCDKRDDVTPPKVGPVLPCPFCGNAPAVEWWHNAKFGTRIACDSDECWVNPAVCYSTPSEAANAWNCRHDR